jgi:hypothetical protein
MHHPFCADSLISSVGFCGFQVSSRRSQARVLCFVAYRCLPCIKAMALGATRNAPLALLNVEREHGVHDKPGQHRLCWLSQNRPKKRLCIRCLKGQRIRAYSPDETHSLHVEVWLPRLNQQSQHIVYISAELSRLRLMLVSAYIATLGLHASEASFCCCVAWLLVEMMYTGYNRLNSAPV